MNFHQIYFWSVFFVIALAIFYFDRKHGMLRDTSTAGGGKPSHAPFSFARVQLAWWMGIVLTSMIATIFTTEQIPTLSASSLVLLGISTATTALARVIDVDDVTVRPENRHQNTTSAGLLIDVLSDEKGVSIHRFQALVLNFTFGIWFIYKVLGNLSVEGMAVNAIIPDFQDNNLILLGLSSGTYTALKTGENRVPVTNPTPPAGGGGNPAAGSKP